ncbi:carbamoyl-phosphate synthase large subunit [Evansella caseinilytica]|uniref:Carbamoyl-phosphate synthase large subunit n=1 Tax=Evansella caseinilytica TaxID=1503961 RepID=A0A1H3HTI7_9BACI|nr:ATP-grasp domain-containing protein [Evansella caseinilytica]SDY18074.1 carbamoyl-phosphate synthase large subunit [Evansella caseinilytica]
MNVLITNIGRRGYLVDFIKAEESFCGQVFVADCDETASGLYSNHDGRFLLPRPVEEEARYVAELLSLCRQQAVDIVIPVIDPEIYLLSKHKELFAKERILVVVSDFGVLETCCSKLKMNDFLRKNGFDVVPTFTGIRQLEAAHAGGTIDFPVFIKPVNGSGSSNCGAVHSLEELNASFREQMLIQPLLTGDEYGVDVFNDSSGMPVRLVIKKKLAMRSGETDKAVTVFHEQIHSLALRLAKALKHFGPLDLDIIVEQGRLYVIDMNPRLGGGYPATHLAGVDFLQLLMQMHGGTDPAPEFNNYKAGLLTMKDIGIKTCITRS